ncbi:MAG: hypothetical protein AAB524_01285 [Patescibacteria group bacterium]
MTSIHQFNGSGHRANAIPADGVWFELEVDNDIDPLEIVTLPQYEIDGSKYPKYLTALEILRSASRWSYIGPKFEGKKICRVKFVSLGYVETVKEAERKVVKMGYRLLEGQALKSFIKKFPKPDERIHPIPRPIIFGGSEWKDPEGEARVPYLMPLDSYDGWDPYFVCSNFVFAFPYWRWLIVSE